MKQQLDLFKNCIPASVYRNTLGDCTNNGISSDAKDLILPLIKDIDTSNLENGCLNGIPVVRVVKRVFGYGSYIHVEPILEESHCMAGGNFLYSCDARFRDAIGHSYPVSIHDRVER